MPKPLAKAPRKSRIQHQNQAVILKAALEVFSAYGYRGTTVDQIANLGCGLIKPEPQSNGRELCESQIG